MRIVGGLAKGRRLAPPPRGTRPTSDRVREALFNSLAGLTDIDGARLLDLYAGTGAVGLEALSRGAGEVVFVESGRAALAVLRRNIETVGLRGARVVDRTAAGYLAGPPEATFDVVFADPPYAIDDEALAAVLAGLTEGTWLAADAVVVVERSSRADGPRWPAKITELRSRRYGDGVLWYGRRR